MKKTGSENSIQDIEFSKKSASSSEENPILLQQKDGSQSDNNFFMQNKDFSESSEKSAFLSIEKNAFLKNEERKKNLRIENSKTLQKINELNDYSNNLHNFLNNFKINLYNEREISNKSEEIINLNSRLNQMYNENQSLEEKLQENEKKLKIMDNELNKSMAIITEHEFLNKQLSEENHILKNKVHEYASKINEQQINFEKLLLENEHLAQKEDNLKRQNMKLIEELNERNKETYEYFTLKKKIEILKDNIYDEIKALDEENFAAFLEENDFLKLLRLFIKERTQLQEQVKKMGGLTEEINKLKKCLEIQTNENRIVIEERSSYIHNNDRLLKINYELETKLTKALEELSEKKGREKQILEIIEAHYQIKTDLERKNKVVAEILLLLSFYEEIRLAFQERSQAFNFHENNVSEIPNLLSYSYFKEEIKELKGNAFNAYPNLMQKITKLLQEKEIYVDNSTQIEKEDGFINIEELQKENEKIKKNIENNQLFFKENIKIKVNTLKFYIEELFGWRMQFDGKLIRLENKFKHFDLYFLVENNEISLINRQQILEIMGTPHLESIPEIVSYLTIF